MSINSNVFTALSCTSFSISGLILRSLIHFKLILVQGERHGSGQFSACRYPVFPATFVEEAFFHCMFSVPLSKNQVGIAAWIHI
jgi:hypothetical protein